jgi:hypothetical protein
VALRATVVFFVYEDRVMKEVEAGQVWQDDDVIVITLYPRPDIDLIMADKSWRWTGTWHCLIVAYEKEFPEMLGTTSNYSVADERSCWRRLF